MGCYSQSLRVQARTLKTDSFAMGKAEGEAAWKQAESLNERAAFVELFHKRAKNEM